MKRPKSIFEWKELLQHETPETLANGLRIQLKKLRHLESIYQTGGENNHFSQTFKDAAAREHQDICIMTGAIEVLLREVGIKR
jgi:hypothetical protein